MKLKIFFVILLSIPNLANAILATPATGATSNLSHKVALGAVVTGGAIAVNKKGWLATLTGSAIAAGGIGLSVFDPPPATYYSGEFSFYYDSSLMKINNFGWLGEWGEDVNLVTLPVDPNLWDGIDGNGSVVVLQQPNVNLNANVVVNDVVNGLLTVAFDWGLSGYSTESVDPFNFFAIEYEFTENVKFSYLGDFEQQPFEANVFVSTPGIQCSIPSVPDEILGCGEPTTSYFRIREVPEPQTLGIILIGGLFIFKFFRKNRCE